MKSQMKYKTIVRAALLVCLATTLVVGNRLQKTLNSSAFVRAEGPTITLNPMLLSASADDAVAARQVDSDGADFQLPVNLSNTFGQASTLSDVASEGGRVYVVWREESAALPATAAQEIWFRSYINSIKSDNNSSGKLLAKLPDSDKLFSLRVAAFGKKIFVLAAVGKKSSEAKAALMRSTDGGDTFSNLENILPGNGGSPFPDMAIDGEGNIHVVMEDRGETGEIIYSRSTDGGIAFSFPEYISGTANRSFKPRIAAKGNNVGVVWHERIPSETNTQSDIQFIYSTDNGKTFSAPLNLSDSATANSVSPAIALGNSIHVVWAEGDKVVHRSSRNGTKFTPAVQIGSAEAGGSIRSPRIAVSGDTVGAVWMTGDSENRIHGPFFRRSKNNGAAFGPEQRLSEDASGLGFEPAAIAADGSIRVVWSHSATGSEVDSEVFMQAAITPAVTCNVLWRGQTSGKWTDPTMWSTNAVPGPSDDVCITLGGNYIVTLNGAQSVRSLTIGSTEDPDVKTLKIEGSRPFSTSNGIPAVLTVANGIANSGVISLTANGFGADSTLTVSGGALTNSSTGVIETIVGGGGARTINANLVNDGAVNFNVNTTYNNTFANNGNVSIAATRTLSFGAGAIFNQNGGTLNIGGTFSMASSTFNFNGGTISGTAILNNSALNIGAGSIGTGTFIMRLNGALSGNIASGQKILIEGFRPFSTSNGLPAVLTAATGFTNSGTITLTSNGDAASTLTVNSGALMNSSTGVIETVAGGNGARTLSADLVNDGAVNFNVSTTLNKSGGVYTNNNTVNIAASKTLTISSGTFKNVSPGAVAGGGNLTLNSGTSFFGAGNVAANITNSGQFSPGLSPGLLNITGTYRQNPAGALNIEIGGPTAGADFDKLNISGSAALAGTLNVSTVGGYCPEGSFEIMTFASRSGDFSVKNGLNLGGGRALVAAPTATNYVLTKTGPACNAAPVANNDSYSINEGTTLNVAAPGVLGNDSDDGGALTAVLLTGASNGTLNLAANGSFTYTPNAGFTGADSFTYKANDGVLSSNAATVSLIVNNVNSPPNALDDAATANQGAKATVNVLANDTDADGDTLTVTSVTQGVNGTVVINPDGTVSYTPGADSCGTDSFNYTISDGNGGTDAATVSITIIDATPPTLTAPPAVNVDTGAGATSCGAVISDAKLGTATAADSCSEAIITRIGVPAGNFFSVGVTTITYKAKDAAGNEATATQTVTVTDTTPPTITAPPAVTISTGADADSCSTIIDDAALGTATVSDNCSTSVNITRSGVPAGNLFPIGETTITYTAADSKGNSASATQKVTVVDNTKPVINAPPNASYQCLGQVPAAKASDAAASDNCGVPTIAFNETNNGGDGSSSNPLIITRTYVATDAAGNSASAVQTITVIDNTPPLINCPANITVTVKEDVTSAVVNYPAPTAPDNCSGAVSVTSVPPSGSVFPLGTTTVAVTAKDAAGNVSSCSFTVTVIISQKTPIQLIEELIARVEELVSLGALNNGQGNSLIAKLEAAIQQITKGNFKPATNQLQAFINEAEAMINSGNLTQDQGQPLIDGARSVISQLGG